MIRVMVLAVAALLFLAVGRPSQGRRPPGLKDPAYNRSGYQEPPPPGMTRTVLLDNDTTLVARLGYEAGKGETSHTHPFSAVVVQLTPGEVDMVLGTEHSRAHRETGTVWFIPANVPHAAINTGTAPCEQIAITLKPTRPAAPAAPPTEAPPGLTRTTVVDNADTRVVRVRFAPASREPVHTHPNDLLTVQLTPGIVEILVGGQKTSSERAPGFVQFLPRNVEHAYVSGDTRPFELLSVTIK
jgi:quercetin dioxygenase-like cupin family protein